MSVGKCDRCGVEIDTMAEVGYLGPVDREDTGCHPFMAFETVCRECETKAQGEDLCRSTTTNAASAATSSR